MTVDNRYNLCVCGDGEYLTSTCSVVDTLEECIIKVWQAYTVKWLAVIIKMPEHEDSVTFIIHGSHL